MFELENRKGLFVNAVDLQKLPSHVAFVFIVRAFSVVVNDKLVRDKEVLFAFIYASVAGGSIRCYRLL